MSKPVLEDIFRFSGRRNRKSYNLYLIVSWFVGAGGQMVGTSGEVALVLLGMLIMLVVGVSQIAVTTQRFRDFGWTGWSVLIVPGFVVCTFLAYLYDVPELVWVIIFLSVCYAVALMCVPGSRGDNRYGPDPLR